MPWEFLWRLWRYFSLCLHTSTYTYAHVPMYPHKYTWAVHLCRCVHTCAYAQVYIHTDTHPENGLIQDNKVCWTGLCGDPVCVLETRVGKGMSAEGTSYRAALCSLICLSGFSIVLVVAVCLYGLMFSPQLLWTNDAAQARFELTVIFLPRSLDCWVHVNLGCPSPCDTHIIIIYFETVPLIGLELTDSAGLTVWWAPGTHPSLLFQCWDTFGPPCPIFIYLFICLS